MSPDLSAQQTGCANGEEGDLYTGAGPLPPSQEEQDLADVVTPGF
jgi:hypothetical protein